MSIETLKFLNKTLINNGINYEFMEYNSELKYPYFVGEYNENELDVEDGMMETSFILTGFTRGKWLDLEIVKEKIEKLFNDKTTILKNNIGVVISYQGSLVLQTGDAELKKMQINLKIKEWKVDLDV